MVLHPHLMNAIDILLLKDKGKEAFGMIKAFK